MAFGFVLFVCVPCPPSPAWWLSVGIRKNETANFFVFLFETKSHRVPQAGLELTVLS